MNTKCGSCGKKIEIRVNECDKSGMTWHCSCFCCCICRAVLNEKSVNIRGENKLYCQSHAAFQEGFQPTCKIYGLGTLIRVVF